ncbi:MAG: cupin domain-containing protein [Anaerolineales bacterium]
MAKAEDEILDAEGYGLIFRKTAQDTQGELLEMEAFYRPKGELPPQHYHPHQEEYFQVLAGTFLVVIGTDKLTFSTGEDFKIPAGTSHAMQNVSAEKGQLLWQTRPALQSEGFFETVWKMDRDSPSDKRTLGQILQLALIFQEYSREVHLSNPSQRIILKLLAPVARILGYKAQWRSPQGQVQT